MSELASSNTIEQDSTYKGSTESISVEVTYQIIGSSMTSSSPRKVSFYFQCAVLVVAVVGVAANGIVLYAMVASKQHKKNVLIFNQNVLDCVSCLFLFLRTPVELSKIYLSGTGGYWLCLMLLSYAGSWTANLGSLVNLAAIGIEHYLKAVHHVWAKKKLQNWMIYLTITFTWICGIVIAAAITVPTTSVVNGVCHAGIIFLKHETARKAIAVWDFLSFYAIVLLISVLCYGHILVAIRRQAKVMAAHSGQGTNTAGNEQSQKIQTSVIKTMILVSGLFAFTWGPVYAYTLFNSFHPELIIDHSGLYTVLSIAYLYICINPFIYATKFDPVKCILLGLIPFKKNSMQTSESEGNT